MNSNEVIELLQQNFSPIGVRRALRMSEDDLKSHIRRLPDGSRRTALRHLLRLRWREQSQRGGLGPYNQAYEGQDGEKMTFLKSLQEVTDLQTYRARREEQSVAEAMDDLNHAVAAVVDTLVQKGMRGKDAVASVVKHLNDVVTGYDLAGSEGLGMEEENEDLERSLRASKPWPINREKLQRSREHQAQRKTVWQKWADSPEGRAEIERTGKAWKDYGEERRRNPREWTGD